MWGALLSALPSIMPKDFSISNLLNVGKIPLLGDIPGIQDLLDLLSFPTHRPDADELEPGTQWLGGNPDRGVIEMYSEGGAIQYRWKGEILSTQEDDYPIGKWDYADQGFHRLIAVSRDGACIFQDPETGPPTNFILDLAREKSGIEAIAAHKAPREAGDCRYITEQIRGESWDSMRAKMARYALEASQHGLGGGSFLRDKVRTPAYYKTPEGAIVAGGSGIASIVGGLLIRGATKGG